MIQEHDHRCVILGGMVLKSVSDSEYARGVAGHGSDTLSCILVLLRGARTLVVEMLVAPKLYQPLSWPTIVFGRYLEVRKGL